MKKKSIPILLLISFIIFGCIAVANAILSIAGKSIVKPCFINWIILCIWVYGLLASLGFVKKYLSENEDGVIEYDTPIPFLPVGILRILEYMYYAWLRRMTINYKVFALLIALDVMYTIILLLDKSNNYYVSEEEDLTV